MRTGIVLAGGRSSRFGSDKLEVEMEGRSLLARAVDAVASITDGVLVAVATPPGELLVADVPVRIVRDPARFEGPLAALANVLATAVDPDPVADLAIVVGGDMPRLVPAVLRSMVDHLERDPAVEAVVLERPPSGDPGGARTSRRAVLPLAVRIEAARRASAHAAGAGDRSLQALVERLRHVSLPASVWLALDPDARTLLDVDTVADLERIRRA